MNRRMIVGTVVAMLAILVYASCTPIPAPSVPTAGAPATAAQQRPVTGGGGEWEARWEKTLSAAKREGELLVYANITAEGRVAMTNEFARKFGIKADFITGRADELVTRLNSEYRAGVYQVDAIIAGNVPAMRAKPLGFMAPIEPTLILPEVKDPRAWLKGELPFFDKDRTVLEWLGIVTPGIVYNSDLVKQGQIGSHLDLLKPEWKDKVVMNDPTISGAMSHVTLLGVVWGLDKAKEYLSSMLKQQKAVVTRDQYQQLDWVARGKYPVALWPNTPPIVALLKAGAPLVSPSVKEGKRVTASYGGLAMPTRPPHPDATIIFINWLMSREAQELAVRTFAAPTTRADVAPEGVLEMFTVRAGDKITYSTEEFVNLQYKWSDEWKRIMDQ